MTLTCSRAFCFLFILSTMIPMIAASQPPGAPVRIEYALSMPHPATHIFHVTLLYSGLPPGIKTLDVMLPAWRPGRYVLFEFAGGVVRFDALTDGGSPLRWSKTDKSTWRIELAGSSAVSIQYEVFAEEFEQRTRGLDDEHAFVNGAAVFMYAPEYRSHPVSLTVVPPHGWHVTTGLESASLNLFHAPGYDTFVDCPLEIGTQKDFAFEAEGVPHVLSIFGGGNWQADTLTRDIAKIVRVNREFWGRLPYSRYVFLLHSVPDEGGGTEHMNSTIMGTQPFVFRNPDTYRGFLGLVSHEYFHTWNVKQIRPAALSHPDYQKENYTEELWMAEGTTSYYGGVLLVRAGLSTRGKFLDGIAHMVYDDRLRPGNAVQSLAESGFDAWIKYWRGNRDAFNEESDYYEKGSAASLVLDLEIRHATGNARSFDDVMRELFRRFPRSGPGYTNADVRRIVGEIGGEPLKAVFDSLVNSTARIDWEKVLAYAGLDILPSDAQPGVWTGMDLSDYGGKTRVTRVIAGSPSFSAGLDAGDEVLALEGMRINAATLPGRLKDYGPGDTIRLTVFRNDRLREFSLKLTLPAVTPYRIKESGDLTPAQKALLDSWLPSGG